MVGNVHGSHSYAKSAAERVREHGEDPDRVTSGYSEDDLMMKYLSPVKGGLWTRRNRYARGGLVGWFDFTEQRWNELTETRSPVLPRQSSGSQYHSMDLIVGDLTGYQSTPLNCAGDPLPSWRELFAGGRWTDLDADRLPRSNWNEYSNSYYLQPDFAASTAPESVDAPDGQAGIDDFDCDASPCAYGEVRHCACCWCPEGHKSVRARKDKEPTYVCNAPNCSWSGESPDVFPARRD